MPQAILFDMDDTIITWETPPDTVWNTLCRRYAPEADGLQPEKLFEAIDRIRSWYWSDKARHRAGRLDLYAARREIIRLAFTNLKIDNPALADKIADTFSANREATSSLVPGAIKTLKHLRQQAIRLALITNGGSEMQRAKIKKFGLAPFFDNILIEGEFGCGKPDERVFLHSLEKLNVPPADAWMVGDDLERDISPCRPLGIYALWVDGRKKGLPTSSQTRPDGIIQNISEIPGLL